MRSDSLIRSGIEFLVFCLWILFPKDCVRFSIFYVKVLSGVFNRGEKYVTSILYPFIRLLNSKSLHECVKPFYTRTFLVEARVILHKVTVTLGMFNTTHDLLSFDFRLFQFFDNKKKRPLCHTLTRFWSFIQYCLMEGYIVLCSEIKIHPFHCDAYMNVRSICILTYHQRIVFLYSQRCDLIYVPVRY